MPCEYFLLIRHQRQPCLLAIDDGLRLAGQHAGRGLKAQNRFFLSVIQRQIKSPVHIFLDIGYVVYVLVYPNAMMM